MEKILKGIIVFQLNPVLTNFAKSTNRIYTQTVKPKLAITFVCVANLY